MIYLQLLLLQCLRLVLVATGVSNRFYWFQNTKTGRECGVINLERAWWVGTLSLNCLFKHRVFLWCSSFSLKCFKGSWTFAETCVGYGSCHGWLVRLVTEHGLLHREVLLWQPLSHRRKQSWSFSIMAVPECSTFVRTWIFSSCVSIWSEQVVIFLASPRRLTNIRCSTTTKELQGACQQLVISMSERKCSVTIYYPYEESKF